MNLDQLSGADLFEKQGAILLAQSGGCAVWQFRNETGDGTMTTYDVFPTHHYHGLTVVFARDIVGRSLPAEIRDFPATPERIIQRWELGLYPRVIHGAEPAEPIFSGLYRVPETIRIPFIYRILQ